MLSQAVGYAISAMGHIAAAGGSPVLVKEIAEAAGIPQPYLAKIVHALGRRGLVVTQRGVGGGVTLARTATGITLLDVCVALDPTCTEPACMLGNAPCSDDRACPAHKFWGVQRAKILEFLANTTVADVAAFESRRRWRQDRGQNAGPGPLSAIAAMREERPKLGAGNGGNGGARRPTE
jgi:Rrf2 family protein